MDTAQANAAGRDRKLELLWLGVAAGIMLGMALAVSRRRKSGWVEVPESGQPIESWPDFAAANRDVASRRSTIYRQGLEMAADAGKLWIRGRKLVGY